MGIVYEKHYISQEQDWVVVDNLELCEWYLITYRIVQLNILLLLSLMNETCRHSRCRPHRQ